MTRRDRRGGNRRNRAAQAYATALARVIADPFAPAPEVTPGAPPELDSCHWCGRALDLGEAEPFPADAFRHDGMTVHGPRVIRAEPRTWCACRKCSPMVHTGDTRGLARRYLGRLMQANETDLPELDELQRMFATIDGVLHCRQSVG